MKLSDAKAYEQFKKEAFVDRLKHNEIEWFSLLPEDLRFKLYYTVTDVARITGWSTPVISKYIKQFQIMRYDTSHKYHPSRAKGEQEMGQARLRKLRMSRRQVAMLMEIGRLRKDDWPTKAIKIRLQDLRRMNSSQTYRAVIVDRRNVDRCAHTFLSVQHVITENFFRADCDMTLDEARLKAGELCKIFRERGYELVYLGEPDVRRRTSKGRMRLQPGHCKATIERAEQRRIAARSVLDGRTESIAQENQAQDINMQISEVLPV
jgi:hypothetical protein